VTTPEQRRERGSGLITSVIGTFLVLATVFVSVEVLVTMYRRTVLTGVADDLARRLARNGGLDPDKEARIAAAGLGPGVRMRAYANGEDIVVTASARGPGIGPLAALKPFGTIERVARAHREQFRVAR
jgi:hypothetical protein